MSTTTRRHWAIEWTHGRTCDEGGRRSGTYKHFPNKAARDAWVDASRAEFSTSPGWRDPLPASDPEVRRHAKVFDRIADSFASAYFRDHHA